ncbi:hypothetical protein STENM223S_07419 [Streptomyces tendae]
MRHYEVMVILDPDLEERAVSPLIENFLSVVRDGGGKVEKVAPGAVVVSRTRSRRSPRASTRSSTCRPSLRSSRSSTAR